MKMTIADESYIALSPSERLTIVAALTLWAGLGDQTVRKLITLGIHQHGILVDVPAIEMDAVETLQRKVGEPQTLDSIGVIR